MQPAEARALMEAHVSDPGLRKHCLASAAVLSGLADKLGHDPEAWAVAGLLHDLDYDQTADHMDQHGLVTADILAEMDIEPEIIDAIKAHNAENLGLVRRTPLDYALTCGETITGLVVATTLVYPDKKLASVKPKSVVKRMKEKSFAAGVNRDHVLLCEQLGLTIQDFAALAVQSMREISEDLGL